MAAGGAAPERRRDGVQSLDRALDVPRTSGRFGRAGRVPEVAARSGLVVSTAHRLLAGLANRGYVGQNPANGRYALGFKVLELAGGLEVRTSPLRAAARPHLERVQEATSETTNLVILDGDRVVYVDQVEGSHSVRMFTRLGSSALAHTTGSGKAILTHRPPEVIEKLYPRAREPFERPTPQTLTTLEALRDDFGRILGRRGYALDREEHEQGVEPRGDAGVRPYRPGLRRDQQFRPTARIMEADMRTLASCAGTPPRTFAALGGTARSVGSARSAG